ncbi:hypothetical protein TNIN_478331, partial [Trichonephila inaurata madagascariensis]
AADSTNQPKC